MKKETVQILEFTNQSVHKVVARTPKDRGKVLENVKIQTYDTYYYPKEITGNKFNITLEFPKHSSNPEIATEIQNALEKQFINNLF